MYIKKKLLTLIPTIFMIGTLFSCKGNTPTPEPEPEPTPTTKPIDFDFNPIEDSNIVVDKGEERQVQIRFKDDSYAANAEKIEWSIKDETKISKVDEASDHVWFKFKADNITDDFGVELTVKVTSKDGVSTKQKTSTIIVEDPLNKDLKQYEGYYSYLKKGTIPANRTYVFTATQDKTNNLRFFGMSNYKGEEPYFDIGYKDSTKLVNVKSIIKDDNGTKTELEFGTKDPDDAYLYRKDVIVVNKNLFSEGNKIIIECEITKELTEGFWFYVGSSNY